MRLRVCACVCSRQDKPEVHTQCSAWKYGITIQVKFQIIHHILHDTTPCYSFGYGRYSVNVWYSDMT